MPSRRPLEARRRFVARVSLYGSLLLVSALAAGTWVLLERPMSREADVTWSDVEWAEQPAVRFLQQLVRVDTTAATGDELTAALLLATPLEAAGLPVTVVDMGKGRANLWAELPGKDPEALLLLGHLDVEPIPPATLGQWQRPPFSGLIEGPHLIGRGTFDMKSYLVAQIWALLGEAGRPEPPERAIRFVATSSEESGSELGARWLLREHPEVFTNVWGGLTEGGVIELRQIEDVKYWGIEIGQKRFVEVTACSSDPGLLEAVAETTRRLGDAAPVTGPLPEVEAFWRTYAPTRDRDDLRQALSDPGALSRDRARLDALPSYLQAQLRDRSSTFPVAPVAGGAYQLRILLQLLPGSDLDSALARFVPAYGRLPGVSWAIAPNPPASFSPTGHPLFLAVAEAVRSEYPHATVGPFFLAGTATDARFVRPLGLPVYGLAPFPIFATDTYRVGHPDEKIGLPGFAIGVELYRKVVGRVAGSQPRST